MKTYYKLQRSSFGSVVHLGLQRNYTVQILQPSVNVILNRWFRNVSWAEGLAYFLIVEYFTAIVILEHCLA